MKNGKRNARKAGIGAGLAAALVVGSALAGPARAETVAATGSAQTGPVPTSPAPASAVAAQTSPPPAPPRPSPLQEDRPETTWQELRASVTGDKPLGDGTGLVTLEAPSAPRTPPSCRSPCGSPCPRATRGG